MFLPLTEEGPKYKHYKQAAKSGIIVPELVEPDMPRESQYIFDLWEKIYLERDSSISLQVIKIRDIIAYCNAFGLRLDPFEIELIIDIDSEYVKVHGKK